MYHQFYQFSEDRMKNARVIVFTSFSLQMDRQTDRHYDYNTEGIVIMIIMMIISEG